MFAPPVDMKLTTEQKAIGKQARYTWGVKALPDALKTSPGL
jgi:hypothetical protein